MSVKIICINKDAGNHYNPHEAIERFGWLNESTKESGYATMGEMIKFLEAKNTAYVVGRSNPALKAFLYVNERNGKKFVQTYADGKWSDNLLQLSECKV